MNVQFMGSLCVDQSQGLKSAKGREREREIIDIKKAPLLRRAALKTELSFSNTYDDFVIIKLKHNTE